MTEFGDKLREFREKRGLTVNQLGIFSGVSPALISKLENGKRGVPKPDTIEKLAKGLKMRYEDLMIHAGHIPESDELTNKEYNDAETTIRLIKEEAARMGLSVDDPVFQKLLSDAFDMLRLARGKDSK